MSQVIWRVRRQAQNTVDTDLYDVTPVTESVNRFANGATLLFDDPDGTKKADYIRGQRVELEVSTDGGSTYTRRLAGFVQDASETSDGAADRLEVSLVGYDHWLRVRRVEESYSSTTLSAILDDIVNQYTPVKWASGNNVTVENDKTVTWDVTGEKVDSVIDRIASASADEDYGVNDDFEFFFDARETSRAGSDIVDGDWFRYNLPEQGQNAVNRVDLFYGASGSRARVTVEDRAEQRDLADKLGVSGNVVISEEVTYERLSNEDAAEAKAREILNERSPVLTGTVTTFGRFDMDAGDVFRLQIGEKDLDTDFRIAQIEYYWSRDETVVTVAENKGNVEDLLVGLADDVKRVDLRAADFGAVATRYLDLRSGVTCDPVAGFSSVSVDADQFQFGYTQSVIGYGSADTFGYKQTTTFEDGIRVRTIGDDYFIPGVGGTTSELGYTQEQFGYGSPKTTQEVALDDLAVTTAFVNQLRDVWQGEAATAVTHVAVGTGTEDAVSTDTDLSTEVAREGAIEREGSSTSVEFVGQIDVVSATDITELGFFDSASGGDMFVSGVCTAFDAGRRESLEISVTVTIADDSDLLGVITDKGQQRLVDLYLGGTGHEPATMLYGTGTTDAATSDTSLTTQVASAAIDSTADRARGITDIVERLTTSEGNGNDLSELGYENSANELLAHIVFDAVAKDNTFALQSNYLFRAVNA